MSGRENTQAMTVHTVRLDRLSLLLELFREEALTVATRARLEDEIKPDALQAVLGLIGRIDSLSDRLIGTLTNTRGKA